MFSCFTNCKLSTKDHLGKLLFPGGCQDINIHSSAFLSGASPSGFKGTLANKTLVPKEVVASAAPRCFFSSSFFPKHKYFKGSEDDSIGQTLALTCDKLILLTTRIRALGSENLLQGGSGCDGKKTLITKWKKQQKTNQKTTSRQITNNFQIQMCHSMIWAAWVIDESINKSVNPSSHLSISDKISK